MKEPQNFDPKCYDLADAFLSDHPQITSVELCNQLAAEIQQTIEDFLQYELCKQYKHIQAWGMLMQSFAYYILEQQHKALEMGAPIDAIYYDDNNAKWVRVTDVLSPSAKERVTELVNMLNTSLPTNTRKVTE